MKSIAKQVELFFVDPSVLCQRNTAILGHFTSSLAIPNYSKSTLTISVSDVDNSISDIEISVQITLTPSYDHYNNPNLSFLNDSDLKGILGNNELQLYKSIFNSDIISEIMFLEVPSLINGLHSYVFFGFVDVSHSTVINHHTSVFYTEDGEVKKGGEAPHEMGNNIVSTMHNSYAFGFGRKLKLNGTSTKNYLEGTRKYLRMLSDPEQKNNPELKKVFAYNMPEYLDYIVAMTKILDKKGLDFRPFWQTKEISDMYDEISKSAMKEQMSKEKA